MKKKTTEGIKLLKNGTVGNFVEENLVLGSEVTSCTVIYFAYESLYLTFLFIKNLTVVMHF